MDSVLLDTDVFSYFANGHTLASKYEPHVEGKLKAVSFVTVGEMLAGAQLAGWGAKRIAGLEALLRTVVIIPYDLDVCRAYAKLCALKQPNGTARTIAANDRWIAACAIRHGVPLVSNNRRHYEGIPGLTLISEAP
jgi:predicted nucleic acid-binding protein